MVNTDLFIKRLEKILEYYQFSASAFADKIGVQRSSLSHLLSGRNKPSLDLVMKITREFEEVDLYWLLNGKGSFPKNTNSIIEPSPTIATEKVNPSLFDDNELIPLEQKKSPTENTIGDENIERIVVFYKDGTFKTYQHNA